MTLYIDAKGNTTYIDTQEPNIRVVGDFDTSVEFKVSLELPTGMITQEQDMTYEDNSWVYVLQDSDKTKKGIIKYQVRGFKDNQVISTNRGLIPNY